MIISLSTSSGYFIATNLENALPNKKMCTKESIDMDSEPRNSSTPVMSAQDTGGVAKGRDQLSNVLYQQLNAVV